MAETPNPQDAKSVIRDSRYRKLLVLAAVVGVAVSLASWGFLTLVPWLQDLVFLDLPDLLGFAQAPWWWPIPILAIAGALTAYVILNLPGGGGGIPADGLSSGVTEPATLPGVLLAGLATLGLGLVLGPSSPVIALGMGLGLFIIRSASPDTPEDAQNVIAVAGSFAALAMVFSNPIIAAIVLIEAIGIGGTMAPVIVLPGLLAAGIGSLVYLGMGSLTGLSTAAYALQPLELPPLGDLTLADFAWAVPLAILCAALGVGVVALAKRTNQLVSRGLWVRLPIVGIVVAVLAIAFAQITGESPLAILLSGSKAMSPIVEQADTLAISTIALLLLLKTAAWTLSMGSFRGGPVFPAIFVGVVAGLFAANLPGLDISAALPIVVAATLVVILRLPLAACTITLLLTASAGLQATALIITSVVVAYVAGEVLRSHFIEGVNEPRTSQEPPHKSEPTTTGPSPDGPTAPTAHP